MGARRPRSPLASLLGHERAEFRSRTSSYVLQGRAAATAAPVSPCGGPWRSENERIASSILAEIDGRRRPAQARLIGSLSI